MSTKEQVIICVDDELSVLEGLKSQLYREFGDDFLIEFAQSGEEALELINDLLKDNYKIPVLISDQLMPGIKGHELLIKMAEISNSTFNILLTGQSDTLAITEAVNKGKLYRYISKPWDGTDLKLTISEAIKSFEKDTKLEEQNIALQKYNQELEEKVKERTIELENKNKEIVDSIKYAKRIQQAILPPNRLLKEKLPEGFIYYAPKDIVAGDFYWFQQIENKKLIAVADCTGHGVPGAMVSVICNNGLNRSVRYHNKVIPGEILDKTREIVIQEFEKSDENVQDGMDIALISIDNDKIEFAGAHNPLYIIKNNSKEVIEIKGNKQPVGSYSHSISFETHSIKINQGDTIYLFSDGFIDQFGGNQNKKYKAKNFKIFLLSIQKFDMNTQEQMLKNEFKEWKNKEEQVDDVCVLGIRF